MNVCLNVVRAILVTDLLIAKKTSEGGQKINCNVPFAFIRARPAIIANSLLIMKYSWYVSAFLDVNLMSHWIARYKF